MKLIDFIPVAAMMSALIIAGGYAYEVITLERALFGFALCAIFGIWAAIDKFKTSK